MMEIKSRKLSLQEKLTLLHTELEDALIARTGEPEPKEYFKRFQSTEKNHALLKMFVKYINLCINHPPRFKRLSLFAEKVYDNTNSLELSRKIGFLMLTGSKLRNIAVPPYFGNDENINQVNLDKLIDLVGFVGHARKKLDEEESPYLENFYPHL